MIRTALFSFFCILAGLFSGALSGQTVPTEYVVDLTDARNHYITVEMTIVPTADTTELMMAVWTPGSYLVREYARNLDSISATDEKGADIEFEKTRKNRWRVNTAGIKKFKFKYRAYCRELSVRTNWVSNAYAVLNGAPTFVTVADRLDQKHIVRLELPDGWTRSATSLKSTGEESNQYVAENFDELVDSPIVAGNVIIYPFEVGGVPHQLVNVGESGFWDGTKAAVDLKKIVAEHQKMWGVVPYDRYLFINIIGGGGGGLEHDNSTLVMSSRMTTRDASRYRRFLSLCSHEFFHTWNIRRLRPRELAKYDYENEVYTPSLWVGEGITSYYQDLLLARAGFMSKTQFLDSLSRSVRSTETTVGRKKQSLRESSFDAWIKYYRPDENSSNTRISYYSKGAVVGFLLDVKIREATGGEKSLDDLMRTLFDKHVNDGYLQSDLRAIASEIAGEDLSEWFRNAVDTTEDLDYQSMIDWFGIEFSGGTSPARPSRGPSGGTNGTNGQDPDDSTPKKTGSPWLGFRTSNGIVTSVTADSPATQVGINIDDEIIAVDGYRVTNIDSVLSDHKVGDELELLMARRSKITTVRINVGARPESLGRLRYNSKATPEQKQRVNDWLGIEPKKEKPEADEADSEEKKSEEKKTDDKKSDKPGTEDKSDEDKSDEEKSDDGKGSDDKADPVKSDADKKSEKKKDDKENSGQFSE